MYGFLSRFRNLMYGRCGPDALSGGLLGLYFVLRSVGRLFFPPLLYAGYVCLALAVLRFFSKNIARRQMENQVFLGLIQPLGEWLRWRRIARQDKDYRYFKCPGCGRPLRVPSGKGKVRVTCRSCGASFEKKT